MRDTGACHDVPSPAHSTGHALRVKIAGFWPERDSLAAASMSPSPVSDSLATTPQVFVFTFVARDLLILFAALSVAFFSSLFAFFLLFLVSLCFCVYKASIMFS